MYVSIAVKEDKVDTENSPKFSDATEKTNGLQWKLMDSP